MGINVVEKSIGGPRGKGSITVLDDKRVEVSITDFQSEKKTAYTLEFPQGVAQVQINNWQLQSADNLSLNLSEDKLDFQYVPRPRDGTFFVALSGFGADEGKPPTIKFEEKRDYEGKPWLPARYKFFALYEILNPGPYQGMELLDTLTYEFEYDENLEEFTIVGDKPKRHKHLMSFLNVYGFDLQNDDLHYTGETYDAGGEMDIFNILPELEDILLSRKKVAQVQVVNGWVQEESIAPGPFGFTIEQLKEMQYQEA